MTCHEVQADLSLYLYGDLDFAGEEAVEAHLNECSFCQLTLNREKSWHAALNTQQQDVPLDLLSACRQDLRARCTSERGAKYGISFWERLGRMFDIRATAWSFRLAAASLLLVVGFGAGRMANRLNPLGYQFGSQPPDLANINFSNPPITRIQNVQPVAGDQVRIGVRQVRDGEISGSLEDEHVRELLLAGVRESSDPGIRVDAVEMLAGRNGQDIRDALIDSVRSDPNAAVRMKALEGLRQFSMDTPTREALKFVLAHDLDAGVRTEAIDVLVPTNQTITITPQLLETLQDVVQGQGDDYVRARCLQVMQGVRASAHGDSRNAY